MLRIPALPGHGAVRGIVLKRWFCNFWRSVASLAPWRLNGPPGILAVYDLRYGVRSGA